MKRGIRKMRGLPDRRANGIPPTGGVIVPTPLAPPGMLYPTEDHGLLLVP